MPAVKKMNAAQIAAMQAESAKPVTMTRRMHQVCAEVNYDKCVERLQAK